MSFYRFTAYIRYRLKAKTRHGIHSPFVYAFIDNCLGVKSSQSLEERINAYFGNLVEWVIDDVEIQSSNTLSVKAIRGIHANAAATDKWHTLAHDTKGVIISIDLYNVGLLVYNPDVKEKQHFVLKYPL